MNNNLNIKSLLYNKTSVIFIFFIIFTSSLYPQFKTGNDFKDIKLKNNFKLSESKTVKPPADDIIINNRPQLILSFIGGYNQPMTELKGDLSTVNLQNAATSAPSYFEKWGYNYGVSGKLSIDKKNMFRVNISMQIYNFLNSGSDSSGLFTIEPELGFVQIGLGAEWSFMRIKKFAPFIGFDIHANSYYGKITFIEDSSQTQISLLYNPVRRYGISAGAGVDFYASRSLGVTAGIKYTIANLFGRNFDASGLHDLNDKSHTVNGVSIPQKTISYINIYAGLSIYLGD